METVLAFLCFKAALLKSINVIRSSVIAFVCITEARQQHYFFIKVVKNHLTLYRICRASIMKQW